MLVSVAGLLARRRDPRGRRPSRSSTTAAQYAISWLARRARLRARSRARRAGSTTPGRRRVRRAAAGRRRVRGRQHRRSPCSPPVLLRGGPLCRQLCRGGRLRGRHHARAASRSRRSSSSWRRATLARAAARRAARRRSSSAAARRCSSRRSAGRRAHRRVLAPGARAHARAPARRAGRRDRRSSCSTSSGSRTSTTRSATTPATRCCAPSRERLAAPSGTASSWRAPAATRSRSSATTTAPRPSWPPSRRRSSRRSRSPSWRSTCGPSRASPPRPPRAPARCCARPTSRCAPRRSSASRWVRFEPAMSAGAAEPARAGAGAAARDRRRRARPALPAQARHPHGRAGRRRGARALGPARPRPGPARRVHRPRRAHRPDPAADGVGARAGGRRPGALGAAGLRIPVAVNLSARAIRPASSTRSPRCWRGRAAARARDHGVGGDARPRAQPRGARAPGGARRAPERRRLRDRPLVARLPGAAAGRRAEDRPRVRGRAGRGHGEPQHRRHDVELAHRLGLEVVAEGVEDDATLAILRAMGCDLAQGFGIARPMPADAVPAWAAGAGRRARAARAIVTPHGAAAALLRPRRRPRARDPHAGGAGGDRLGR